MKSDTLSKYQLKELMKEKVVEVTGDNSITLEMLSEFYKYHNYAKLGVCTWEHVVWAISSWNEFLGMNDLKLSDVLFIIPRYLVLNEKLNENGASSTRTTFGHLIESITKQIVEERRKKCQLIGSPYADIPVGPKASMQGKVGRDELKGWRDTKFHESKINEYISQIADYLCVKPELTANGFTFRVSDEQFDEVRKAFDFTSNSDRPNLVELDYSDVKERTISNLCKQDWSEEDYVLNKDICRSCGSKVLSTGKCSNFNCTYVKPVL